MTFDRSVRSPEGAPTEPVSLTMQQIAALATWHQQQALTAGSFDDMAFHQREAGRLVHVALRMTTEPAAAAPKREVVARVDFSADEVLYIAEGYAGRAQAEHEATRYAESLTFAKRALELRTAAHVIKPALSLEFGHPRLPAWGDRRDC